MRSEISASSLKYLSVIFRNSRTRSEVRTFVSASEHDERAGSWSNQEVDAAGLKRLLSDDFLCATSFCGRFCWHVVQPINLLVAYTYLVVRSICNTVYELLYGNSWLHDFWPAFCLQRTADRKEPSISNEKEFYNFTILYSLAERRF